MKVSGLLVQCGSGMKLASCSWVLFHTLDSNKTTGEESA